MHWISTRIKRKVNEVKSLRWSWDAPSPEPTETGDWLINVIYSNIILELCNTSHFRRLDSVGLEKYQKFRI